MSSNKKDRLVEIENEIQRLGNEYTEISKADIDVKQEQDLWPLAHKAIAFLEDRLSVHELKLLEIYGVIFMVEKVLRHILSKTNRVGEVSMIEKFAIDTAVKMITGEINK